MSEPRTQLHCRAGFAIQFCNRALKLLWPLFKYLYTLVLKWFLDFYARIEIMRAIDRLLHYFVVCHRVQYCSRRRRGCYQTTLFWWRWHRTDCCRPFSSVPCLQTVDTCLSLDVDIETVRFSCSRRLASK